MEETKPRVPAVISQNLEVARWQWQSDPDTYQEPGSAQWAWQNYPDDENFIIEEAYFLKQKTVSLKDSKIDFRTMVQVNLQDRNKVRRVRRQESSRFMMEVPEVKAIEKNQKTMNEAFGTVQHFLEYIMKRTPEAYTLYQRLGKLSLDADKTEFADLIEQVLLCIEKGAEFRAKIIKAKTSAQVKNPPEEAKRIVDMIENNSLTLQDFLRSTLKAYTMETFICYWLNELLRSEDWEEINVLTPYLVCLVYTFRLSDYVLKEQNSQKKINDLLKFVVKHRLYLYRGTALTKEQFMRYHPNETKYFSWNGITSTSRDRNIARSFMGSSLNKKANIQVLFFIEIDFDSPEDYHGLIDVSKDSQYPREQEVILAPGTVFKVLEISLIENDVYEIRLKVTKNIKEVQGDVALLGVLQDQAISKDQAFIDGLPTQQGFRMLNLLKGNKLIRKLEIRDSGIEHHILEEIENMRVTTNVKKEDIKLAGNTIAVSSLRTLVHYFSIDNLNNILKFNKIRFVNDDEVLQQQFQIEKLILTEKTIQMFRNNGQLERFWRRLRNESQIFTIDLVIADIQIEEDELRGFFECIQEVKSLENLTLELNKSQASLIEKLSPLCQTVLSSKALSLKLVFSDEALSLLQNTLCPLGCLRNLSLDCSENRGSEEVLNSLSSTLISLTSLQQLSLNFEGCGKISNEGLDYLQNGLKSLAALQDLSLSFAGCNKILDDGLDHLGSGLALLTSLKYLSLNFNECNKITDKGIYHLQSGLKSLSALQDFSLSFSGCNKISDDGLNHLKSALESLTSLQHLSLDLSEWQISDEGLENFKDSFVAMTSLQRLSIDFFEWYKISSEGINHLKNGLTFLASLKHLSLNFRGRKEAPDDEPSRLKNSASTSLNPLTLNFNGNRESNNILSFKAQEPISIGFGNWGFGNKKQIDSFEPQKSLDDGLGHLASGFKSLTSLQHLSLTFEWCKISDDGLSHLKNGLKSLTVLQHLSLSFNSCFSISNEGLNHLKDALESLTSLEHLSLDFSECRKISDDGLNSLKQGLTFLTALQDLSLNFEGCTNISNNGLDYLQSDLVEIISLQSLSLNFEKCRQISDEGLDSLKSGLIALRSLQHLSLNFNGCPGISGKAIDQFKSDLKSLTLQKLSLNFPVLVNFSGGLNFGSGPKSLLPQPLSLNSNGNSSLVFSKNNVSSGDFAPFQGLSFSRPSKDLK